MPHWLKTHWLFTEQCAAAPRPARGAGVRLLATLGVGVVGLGMLVGCASTALPPSPATTLTPMRVEALNNTHSLGAGVLMLGEQHDAPEHQQLHALVVAHLLSQERLAAVVIEMAHAEGQTTALADTASEAQVQQALHWNDDEWPWASYGPAIMRAVRAHIPVLGGNLQRAQVTAAMQDNNLQNAVSPGVWAHHLEAVYTGHCALVPKTQLAPMARVQVARDQRMAQTIERAVVPGKVVLLLTGSAHANKRVGVAQHLRVPSVSIQLAATSGADTYSHSKTGQDLDTSNAFDWVWATPELAPVDYCAQFKAQIKRK
ncbi:MAG: ChaN family lipoprotein [Burkholderiaceae bacterium]|nr:ChaN family lipoprotein [Burkholderiaceae bacterium]